MQQNIVLVDDEVDHLYLLERMLQKLQDNKNIAIHSFDNAEDALSWCRHHPMSLCFVDYQMPGMDGMDFIVELRQIPEMAHVPIFMITGTNDHRIHEEAREKGVTAVFTKPANLVNVLRAVAALLHLDGDDVAVTSEA